MEEELEALLVGRSFFYRKPALLGVLAFFPCG